MCLIIILSMLFAACNLNLLGETLDVAGDIQEETDREDSKNGEQNIMITAEEDEKIKNLICDYYARLYSEPVESYNSYVASGTIPEKIREIIAEDTINFSEGNRKIGIHLPRYVSLNGVTAIEYEIARISGSEGETVPDIEADCVQAAGGNVHYFVKVNLRTKCIPDSEFNAVFKRANESPVYTKAEGRNVNENLTDYMRIEAKYDVVVKKIDGNYKIVEAKELGSIPGLENRMHVSNNGFVSRKPLINIAKDQKGGNYLNENDCKQYENESYTIKNFFETLKKCLDSSKMDLFYSSWEKGAEQFKGFINKLDMYMESDTGKLSELMSIDGTYKSDFDYSDFILKAGMKEFAGEFENFSVQPHPAYTQRRKLYIVTFDVPVQKVNSPMEGKNSKYRYDYFITLTDKDGEIKIKKIELNECFDTQLLN